MYPGPQLLVHLCPATEWAAAQVAGEVHPDSLRTAGFVHLSTAQQVHLPANRIFVGRTDLVLLSIDPALLTAPVRWEAGLPEDPPGMRFPHLYGPLPVSAVIEAVPYGPGADGQFAPLP